MTRSRTISEARAELDGALRELGGAYRRAGARALLVALYPVRRLAARYSVRGTEYRCDGCGNDVRECLCP